MLENIIDNFNTGDVDVVDAGFESPLFSFNQMESFRLVRRRTVEVADGSHDDDSCEIEFPS